MRPSIPVLIIKKVLFSVAGNCLPEMQHNFNALRLRAYLSRNVITRRYAKRVAGIYQDFMHPIIYDADLLRIQEKRNGIINSETRWTYEP